MQEITSSTRRYAVLAVLLIVLAVAAFTFAQQDKPKSAYDRPATLATAAAKSVEAPPASEPAKPGYNAKGELLRPVGYREWIYVGTPITPNDMNPPAAPFPDFHNVYIHPGDYAHWKQTGKFRDGTVIVKELVAVGTKQATSGKGYFMGDFIGLETLVKDSKRFANEPGNWAFFSFGHKYPLAESTAPQPSFACSACHQGNAETDYVFTQYYPVLRAAKPK